MSRVALKEGDQCLFCKKGELLLIGETFPWDTDHLMCDICHSTYSKDE